MKALAGHSRWYFVLSLQEPCMGHAFPITSNNDMHGNQLFKG
jgi:hypothetical protein